MALFPWPGRPDDDERAVLPAARDSVQRGEAGRDSREPVGLLNPLEPFQRTVQRIAQVDVLPSHVPLNGGVHTRHGALDELVDREGLVEGVPEDHITRLDEVPLDGLLLEDLDVVLDVRPGTDLLSQPRQPRGTAHLVQVAVLPQLLRDGHHVFRGSAVEELGHGGEDEAELRVIEALLLQHAHRLIDALRIHHHRSDNGFFHFRSTGWFMADLGRCHHDRVHLRGPLSCILLCHNMGIR